MSYILCNDKQKDFYQRLVNCTSLKDYEVNYVINKEQLNDVCSGNEVPRLILIEVSLTWDGNLLQNFYGFDIAADLRRDYLIKCPIIFLSSLKRDYFEKRASPSNKYSLVNGAGCGFLSFPFSLELLKKQLSEIKPLSDAALNEVVVKHCDLQGKWQLISHQLGGYISNYRKNNSEVKELVTRWAVSINRFAPDQKSNLENFRNLLKLQSDAVEMADLKRALERLDDGLQGAPSTVSDSSLPENYSQLPRCPPQGFSKVLIADDEPQPFLLNSLRHQYGYNVIEQAYNLSQAKDLLNKEKPDVVLSDLYFKHSLRKTEVPDKSIGDSFIRYALTHTQYANTDLKKPLVLVISKHTLQPAAEIRAGAINCSGHNRATDPIFIHSVIWAEARERGSNEPADVFGQEWTLEHTCRLRLEQYEKDLPDLIKQWKEFKGTVHDTLRLCRLLSQSTINDDPKIVQQVINILEPYESEEKFSFGMVANIFIETERVHKSAQSHSDSQAKQAIRNILHGKIEQFSSVTNAVKFLMITLSEVARNLTSLPRHQKFGQKLNDTLNKYSESKPLLPLLTLLNKNLAEILSSLPELPSPPIASQTKRDAINSNNIKIVVVEDNKYWRDRVISAIESTKSKLGENFTISYQYFDNAADALAAIPSTSKSFAIDGSDQDDVKTIAIVDICLPENHEHAERIRAALDGRSDELEIPRSTHGFDLIHALCGYDYNIPLIVFSTINSIDDRKIIGSWGLSDDDFLSKGTDDENAIVHALIRKIEKKTKYVIKSFEDKSGNRTFWINGVKIPFPMELNETFTAIYKLCRTSPRNICTIEQIVNVREDAFSEKSNKTIQDQVFRIRNLILETLQSNGIYVNVRELIKTCKSPDDDEFTYQLNAELMPLKEEGYRKDDLRKFAIEVCKVLVIENNSQTLGQIIEPLESLGYEVKYAMNVEDAVQVATDFLPHIISLDLQIPYTSAASESPVVVGEEFAGLEAWSQIRVALRANNIGIVVPSVNTDNNYLIAKAAQMEIPIRNFVSKKEANWLNLFLKKIDNEKRRVYLGEITDTTQDISEPIVEILDGSDLSEGVLQLIVNNEPFTMNKSPNAKIIGLLLANPKTRLSFEAIKKGIGSNKPVKKDDSKNWTKRIRAVIREKWLGAREGLNLKELAEKILESSSEGLRLNVQVIDSRDYPSRKV